MIRRNKAKKTENANPQTIENTEDQQRCTISNFEASVDTTFFYTNDRQLNAFDDIEIVSKIVERFPDFVQTNKDTQLKKIFLIILDNKDFVLDLLDYYQIQITDLIRIIYKQYPSLFNPLFIKKVREKLICNKYATINTK